MTEEVAEAPAVADVSAGKLLRRAREASGMHVAALAVALKVPVRKLEALEDDRYQDLGDAVFIRALASSVCRTLKVDAQPVLQRLPQTAAPRLVRDTDGLNAPFRAPSDAAPPSWVDALRQPVPLMVMALLAGAIVIYFLPVRLREEAPAVVTTPAPAPAQVAAAAPAVESASAPVQAASEPAVQAVAAPVAAASAPESVASAPPTPTTGIVVFHTKGESWVEVTDAKGGIVLRKLMAAGETAGATGALPLTVTIGKVDMTAVEVRGKPFNLKAVSKDNVARFEVK
jgi:cytoskeleton protein RodZ